MKSLINVTVGVTNGILMILSPFLVLIASVLTSIKYFSVANGVMAGIGGFILGWGVSSIVLCAMVLALGFVYYITGDN